MAKSTERKPIYCIEKHESGLGTYYSMKVIERRICPVFEKPGASRTIPCVRYETYWRRIHEARELMPLLLQLKSKQYDGQFPDIAYRSGGFRPRRDKKLPFITLWELPLGWYAAP